MVDRKHILRIVLPIIALAFLALYVLLSSGCTAAAPVGWEKPSSHPARAQWEQARTICFRDAMTTRTEKDCEKMFTIRQQP